MQNLVVVQALLLLSLEALTSKASFADVIVIVAYAFKAS